MTTDIFFSYHKLENNTRETLHSIWFLSAVISSLSAYLIFLWSTVIMQQRVYTFDGPSPIFPSISPGERWAENYDCDSNLCLRFHILVFPLCLPLNSEKRARICLRISVVQRTFILESRSVPEAPYPWTLYLWCATSEQTSSLWISQCYSASPMEVIRRACVIRE